jgi:cysteine dioxygenase
MDRVEDFASSEGLHMTATVAAATLPELIAYLDGLSGRAPLDELLELLARTEVDLADLEAHVRFSAKSYTRNLVREGPWYNLLVLCWKNGQRSPIHDHAGSSCAVRVLRGVLTETALVFAPHGRVKAVGSRDLAPGEVMGSQDHDLHQVSNLQDGDAELVTLHVYSPPLRWMGTYSLTDDTRGQEPMLVEFCDAAGI